MSTLIGIKTNSGIERIVLASDHQMSEFEGDTMVSKGFVKKIHYGKNWALGFTGGGETKELRKFFGTLKGHGRYGSNKKLSSNIIETAVKTKIFKEVYELNRTVSKRDRDIEGTYSFIFCTQSPEFGLWEIDEFGNIFDSEENNEFDYICIGSGSSEVEKYLSSIISDGKIGDYKFDKESIDSNVASRIAKRAIQAAQIEPASGFGYDLVVVPKYGKVDSWGDTIKQKLIEADQFLEDEIATHYEIPKNDSQE